MSFDAGNMLLGGKRLERSRPSRLACCIVALSVQCGPKGNSQEPIVPRASPKETPNKSPKKSSLVAVQAKPESPPAPALEEPESEPSKQPSPNALRIGPQLSDEARAAGIYKLTHVPYKWPSQQKRPRTSGEPLVIQLGHPSPLPQPGQPRADAYGNFGYMIQTTITKKGTLAMADGIVDLDKWTTKDAQGARVLTPPQEWEGIVQDQVVLNKGKPVGSSLIAYGNQGLYNYREYVRRYLPWRMKRRDVPAGSRATAYSELKTRLATLMTGDIDADGTPELIAYMFVSRVDAKNESLAVDGEIGIVWKNRKKEPAVLSGFTWMPGAFTIPYVVPARLNGGKPLIYSIEYCCNSSAVRWASLVPGDYIDVAADAEDRDWQIFLEPSKTGAAELLIATGQPVDWESANEAWAY